MIAEPDTEEPGLKPADIAARVRGLVKGLLEEGARSADISFSLAFIATELGLIVAPDPVKVFPVVLDAVGQAAAARRAESEAPAVEEPAELEVPAGASIH